MRFKGRKKEGESAAMGIEERGGGRMDALDLSHLSAAASVLRQRLVKSQATSDQMISILGSFDERLSALESAMRPTQVGIGTMAATIPFCLRFPPCLPALSFLVIFLPDTDSLLQENARKYRQHAQECGGDPGKVRCLSSGCCVSL